MMMNIAAEAGLWKTRTGRMWKIILEARLKSIALGSESTVGRANDVAHVAALPSLGPLTRHDLEWSIA